MTARNDIGYRVLGAALLITVMGFWPLAAQTAPEKEFQELSDNFMAAWAKGDTRAIAALHTKDAVRMTGDSGVVGAGTATIGTAAIEKVMGEALSGPFKGTKLMIKSEGYQRVNADVYVGHGTYEITGATLPPGTPTSGRYLNTMVRESGRWRIAASAVMPSAPQK